MSPRFLVRPSQAPNERGSVVKKNRRAVAELVCHPPIVIDSYGPRIHFEASPAVVVLASIELRPSTDSATAIRLDVRLVSRTEYSSPGEASTYAVLRAGYSGRGTPPTRTSMAHRPLSR